jgi:hypothetical protein
MQRTHLRGWNGEVLTKNGLSTVAVGDVGEVAEHHGGHAMLFNAEAEPDGGPRRIAPVMASR